jgi:osomolarity two-component system, sensor histidine kinase SLN1
MLGDPGLGFPPTLYPNLTYVPTTEPDPTDQSTNLTRVFAFPDLELSNLSSLLLGPLQVNETFAMVSLTLPIINNTSNVNILGFLTYVISLHTFLV